MTTITTARELMKMKPRAGGLAAALGLGLAASALTVPVEAHTTGGHSAAIVP
jgi:hypothetical protein